MSTTKICPITEASCLVDGCYMLGDQCKLVTEEQPINGARIPATAHRASLGDKESGLNPLGLAPCSLPLHPYPPPSQERGSSSTD